MGNIKRAARLCCLLIAVLLAATSCGGKKILPGKTSSSTSAAQRGDEQLFAKAEKMYAAKQYAYAERLYQEYLTKYPRSALAPAAWLQIAQMAVDNQKYEKARDAYRKILAKYPASAMVTDARWGILNTYYKEERYEALIPMLRQMASSSKTAAQERVRALSLLGDVYMSWGEAEKALDSYMKAHSQARTGEKDLLFMKMEKVLDLLSFSQAETILGTSRDCSVKGLLALKLAHQEIGGEQWTQAQETLERLLADCPDQQTAGEAQVLLDDLRQMEGFQQSAIGVLLPLSGPYERFGAQLLSGIEMAISLHNVTNPGRAYRMEVRDTQGDPIMAAQGFRELAEQNVSLVIGPMLAADAVMAPAKEFGVPSIVFTQKQSVTGQGGYLFRNYLTLPMQARTLVTYARETLGLNRFAILFPNDDYGRANMSIFWQEVVRQGGMVTGVESYEPKQTDFADPIKKLVGLYYDRPEVEEETPAIEEELDEEAAAKEDDEPDPIIDFDVLYMPDSPSVSGLVMPQLKFHDVNGVLLMGPNLWHSPKLIDIGGVYANGAVMPDIFFKQSPDPKVREFISLYEDTYGSSPGFLEALGYDSANLTLELMSQPQVYSRESLRQALSQADFHGVTGRTFFDETGEVDKDLYLLKIERGRFVQVPKPELKSVFSITGTPNERPY